MKPPVKVKVVGDSWEAHIEVDGIYGTPAGVAARLKREGLIVVQRNGTVWVNAKSVR
jgi:hypothetical protein